MRAENSTSARSQRDQLERKSGVKGKVLFQHLAQLQVLAFEHSVPVNAMIKELMASGLYESVEPDRIIKGLVVPNDPSFAEQYALNNTGQAGGTANADIRAVTAWDNLHDAPSVIVGVLDSGIRQTHEDLAANLWTNASPSTSGYINDLHGINSIVPKTSPASGNPEDDEGHGTHVAGIIGAVGNNGKGISGVAWKTQLMALKFLDSSNEGGTSALLACINYAIAKGVKVINCSFGQSGYSAAEFSAFESARNAGIIMVAAAGNEGLSVEADFAYPAGFLLDNIVTVAATTRTDGLSNFSNFSSGLVELGAPGTDILSTYNPADNAYARLSGTSMAAPHVTGAIALLLAKYPGDTYRQTINRLLRSTTKLPALAGKVQTGGRLNLQAVLASNDNRPFNDDFAARAQVEGAAVRARSSNVGALKEANEPAHAGAPGGNSLWWSWTAPTTGTTAFSTTGSAYDTLLSVYTGSALNSLVAVGSNDNAVPGVTTSRVLVNVVAGTTYQVAVDGKAAASGLTILRIGLVPPNDNFASAQLVSGPSFRALGTTANATRETGEINHAGVSQGHSVWFRWTAPSSGRFQLAAFGDLADMVAGVYTGSAVNALNLVASNDDHAGYNFNSLVSFQATAGQLYYFAVDSADAEGGDFTISINDSLWQYPAEGPVTSSPAIATDGTIYVGDEYGYLYASNPDGTQRWDVPLGSAITLSTPAIGADGTVYIGTDDSFLHAVNGATGARRWRFAAASAVISAPAIAPDGTIYFRDDTTLYALASGATSATQKWKFALSGPTYSSPSIAGDGTIYVGAIGGAFYAINPDGSQKWRFTADGDIFTTPALATDGTIYFATLAGTLYALNPSGTLRWTWKTADGSSITSSPATGTDGTLYFGGYDHKLHAINSNGTERWSYTMGDEVRASSPVIAADGTIYQGCYDNLVYAVSASGTLQRTYATAGIIRSSPALANGRLYFGSSDYKLYAIAVGQEAATSAWPMFHQNAPRTGRAAPPPAVTISVQPQSQAVAPGSALTLAVTAAGTGALSYQWFKDGVAIPGANGATYTVASVTAVNGGSYTVVVTGTGGNATSSAASVTIAANAASRLVNLSARAVAGPNEQTLIVGFVITGASKSVLVRGIGPGFASSFPQGGTLADPQLGLFDGSTSIQSNIDWEAGLADTFTRLGAFPLTPLSKDAALLTSLAPKPYTAQITGTGGGIALAEIYDADASPAPVGRLVNLSARAQVGTGGNVLIAGFVIVGSASKQVLIRAIGPGLASFFPAGAVLATPQLTVFNSAGTQLESNTKWNETPILKAAMASVGASPLADGSNDAALLVTLNPGAYTAQISGVNLTTGVALIEVYEMP